MVTMEPQKTDKMREVRYCLKPGEVWLEIVENAYMIVKLPHNLSENKHV